MLIVCERMQSAMEEKELLNIRDAFTPGELLSRLKHDCPRRIPLIFKRDLSTVRMGRDDLGDRVEAPAPIELSDDVRKGFEACAEPGPGTAHPFRHGTDFSVSAGEQGDNPVGLIELVSAQDNPLICISSHPNIIDGTPREGLQRRVRLSAEMMALRPALIVEGSMPTPQRILSSISTST